MKLDNAIKHKMTGECEIDVEEIIKRFKKKPDKWFLSQWHDKFTLCRSLRKDSPIMKVKVQVAYNDAIKLIYELKLKQVMSGVFRHGSTWRING